MKKVHSRRILHLAISACLLPVNVNAKADQLQTDATWIIVGTAAIGAALGVGIFYAVHHSASLKGCVVSGANGLELRNEGDHQTYPLLGMTTDIKAGSRVHVTGKKKKASGGASGETFLVEKLAKNYGACEVAAAK